ncbi:HAD domain-containing protein [Streptomyces nigra]
MRPLLYLDVDGPLNPYAAKPHRRPDGYTTHRMKPESWVARHRYTPAHRLVWATTWGAEANTFIAPVLGLPDLPVVEWPPGTSRERSDGPFWKTGPLVEHARGRPFAWVDDELGPADEDFVAARHDGPALLLRIDARLGLREADLVALGAFAGG